MDQFIFTPHPTLPSHRQHNMLHHKPEPDQSDRTTPETDAAAQKKNRAAQRSREEEPKEEESLSFSFF